MLVPVEQLTKESAGASRMKGEGGVDDEGLEVGLLHDVEVGLGGAKEPADEGKKKLMAMDATTR
jgi:hypothetical protein